MHPQAGRQAGKQPPLPPHPPRPHRCRRCHIGQKPHTHPHPPNRPPLTAAVSVKQVKGLADLLLLLLGQSLEPARHLLVPPRGGDSLAVGLGGEAGGLGVCVCGGGGRGERGEREREGGRRPARARPRRRWRPPPLSPTRPSLLALVGCCAASPPGRATPPTLIAFEFFGAVRCPRPRPAVVLQAWRRASARGGGCGAPPSRAAPTLPPPRTILTASARCWGSAGCGWQGRAAPIRVLHRLKREGGRGRETRASGRWRGTAQRASPPLPPPSPSVELCARSKSQGVRCSDSTSVQHHHDWVRCAPRVAPPPNS